MPEAFCPNTCQAPAPAAAIVTSLGKPQVIDPMWRGAAGDVVRAVLDCHLRPIEFVDFYTTLRRNERPRITFAFEPVKGRKVAA